MKHVSLLLMVSIGTQLCAMDSGRRFLLCNVSDAPLNVHLKRTIEVECAPEAEPSSYVRYHHYHHSDLRQLPVGEHTVFDYTYLQEMQLPVRNVISTECTIATAKTRTVVDIEQYRNYGVIALVKVRPEEYGIKVMKELDIAKGNVDINTRKEAYLFATIDNQSGAHITVDVAYQLHTKPDALVSYAIKQGERIAIRPDCYGTIACCTYSHNSLEDGTQRCNATIDNTVTITIRHSGKKTVKMVPVDPVEGLRVHFYSLVYEGNELLFKPVELLSVDA